MKKLLKIETLYVALVLSMLAGFAVVVAVLSALKYTLRRILVRIKNGKNDNRGEL
jgi:ABC-type nickel/cobalt efflux system permease component RcnA